MAKIYLTEFDRERLHALLEKKDLLDEYDQALRFELTQAEIVDSKAIPDNVITMNSQVRLQDDSGESFEYTLVFPEDADIDQNKISILSPIGCSLIGFTVGSTATFPSPKGDKAVKVEEILYQPERAGDLDV